MHRSDQVTIYLSQTGRLPLVFYAVHQRVEEVLRVRGTRRSFLQIGDDDEEGEVVIQNLAFDASTSVHEQTGQQLVFFGDDWSRDYDILNGELSISQHGIDPAIKKQNILWLAVTACTSILDITYKDDVAERQLRVAIS